jgi:REP element-mobilizing transposase RayT
MASDVSWTCVKKARQRHYVNPKDPGITLFITTTVLDFVHAFHRHEVRDGMLFALARECRLARATLYGYVVMPHHVHMVVRLHEKMNGPEFMKDFKREIGRSVVKLLTEGELRQFDEQRGLNGNTFWKYSFRSVQLLGPGMFWQKMNYMHQNPVKAGYVEQAEDYRWSRARLIIAGKWSDQTGIPYSDVVENLGPWSPDSGGEGLGGAS